MYILLKRGKHKSTASALLKLRMTEHTDVLMWDFQKIIQCPNRSNRQTIQELTVVLLTSQFVIHRVIPQVSLGLL